MNAAATAAAEATAVTHSFQAQLASLQQDMQSLQTKVNTSACLHTHVLSHPTHLLTVRPHRRHTLQCYLALLLVAAQPNGQPVGRLRFKHVLQLRDVAKQLVFCYVGTLVS